MAKGCQLAGIDIELSLVSVEPERPLHNHYMTGAVIYPGRLIVSQGIGLYNNGPGRSSFPRKSNAGPRADNQYPQKDDRGAGPSLPPPRAHTGVFFPSFLRSP